VLSTGVVMAICTIGFNLWLIPRFGIIGAAWASLAAMLIYQCVKVWAVYSWIKVHPWQPKMALILVWGSLSWWITDWVFAQIDLPVFAQIAAIACMVSVLYMWGVYRLGLIEYRSIWPKN
jgi:O-antigen/teichoic acid export membrane protein